MGRYLSIPILGFAATLSSSIIPQTIAFILVLLSGITPILNNTRGQLSLVMLLVIAWAIRANLLDGSVWAFTGGIAMDLLTVLPVGTSSFGLILIVFAINTLAKHIYRINLLIIVAITIVATVFMQFYTYQVLLLMGNSYNLLALVRLVLIPTVIYNTIAILPLYGMMRLIQRRIEGGLQPTNTNTFT